MKPLFFHRVAGGSSWARCQIIWAAGDVAKNGAAGTVLALGEGPTTRKWGTIALPFALSGLDFV